MIGVYIDNIRKKIDNLNRQEITRLAQAIKEVRRLNAIIYIFGNGGSGATASHMACDINKLGYRAISLNDNMATFTAYANDFGYSLVFSEQLKVLLKDNDLVIGISGSGNSSNILNAIAYANQHGNITFGITGYENSKLEQIAQYSINANCNDMQMSEDIHLIINHILVKVLNDQKTT